MSVIKLKSLSADLRKRVLLEVAEAKQKPYVSIMANGDCVVLDCYGQDAKSFLKKDYKSSQNTYLHALDYLQDNWDMLMKGEKQETTAADSYFLKTYKDTEKFLKRAGIRGFYIEPETLEVEVFNPVDLSGQGLRRIPVNFKEVEFDFNCSNNKLTSLKGVPSKINGNFECSKNRLATLIEGPSEVKGAYDCSANKLTDLKGAPEKINKSFLCYANDLKSLEGCPKEVSGNFFSDLQSLLSEKDIRNACHVRKSVKLV